MAGSRLTTVPGREERMHTENPGPSAVETAHDDRLPTVRPERYGAFRTGGGETVLYDSDSPDAWVRADCAVELGR
jgi:hypothetical protein